jgi:hypothetical protein
MGAQAIKKDEAGYVNLEKLVAPAQRRNIGALSEPKGCVPYVGSPTPTCPPQSRTPGSPSVFGCVLSAPRKAEMSSLGTSLGGFAVNVTEC